MTAPSIGARLARALLWWALVSGAAVGTAVWLTATEEVDELLDDTLSASAHTLARLLPHSEAALAGSTVVGQADDAGRFAWQWVDSEGRLRARSAQAPAAPWHAQAREGYARVSAWRVYGLALPGSPSMLYVGQTLEERREARLDVAWGAVLAALLVGVLGLLWLRARVRQELQPLTRLSQRLAAWDVPAQDLPIPLGAAERAELEPVHRAVEQLVERLALRIAHEQALAAHAAHALRTPLAGIEAQLAVALRECPPPAGERLQRIRDATVRLQSVVGALLGLFRTGARPQRRDLDVAALLARLPVPGLTVHVAPGARVHADEDLLSAALANLLDNAARHGARQAWVEVPAEGTLRVRDDGPGMAQDKRDRLRKALAEQAYEGVTGLGLMLADRVARVHSGHVGIPDVPTGFAVDLQLADPG